MKRLVIVDKIYGKTVLENPVFQELINSTEVQRLKGISQLGIPDKLHYMEGFSRYEHSIGVLILLIKLGASENEQIAGLLHDVSHTAFSHVVDWVYGDTALENFQDNNHKKVIEQSSLPKILTKYNYNYEQICDLDAHSLLDKEIPDLCADRIDYSLRQMPGEKVPYFLENLRVIDGEIVFVESKSALEFSNNFLDLQTNHWAGYEGVSRYKVLSDILRDALDIGIITKNDFWENDDYILDKLVGSKDTRITYRLEILKQRPFPATDTYKCERVYKKFRYVDPKVIDGDDLVRLSEINENFNLKLRLEKRTNKKGILVPKLI